MSGAPKTKPGNGNNENNKIGGGGQCGVVANVLDCNVMVGVFKL